MVLDLSVTEVYIGIIAVSSLCYTEQQMVSHW